MQQGVRQDDRFAHDGDESDFTYVATWCGFVYVAFVIDAHARRIVGRRVSRSAEASFVLDAWSRRSTPDGPSKARA